MSIVDPPDLIVIGRGRVGIALADALAGTGWTVQLHAARALPAELSAPRYLLCVRDPQLGEIARAVIARHRGAPPVLLHTAGGIASSVLRDAGATSAAMLHPLVAFAGAARPALAGALFAIEGDEGGRAEAQALCARLGGHPVELQREQLPAYHAAAALAANHVLALVAIAQGILVELGVDPALAGRGIGALFGGVASNLGVVGLPAALTGPIARGDGTAVAHHLRALADRPDALAVYCVTAPALIALARAQGKADPAALDALAARLPLYAPTNLD